MRRIESPARAAHKQRRSPRRRPWASGWSAVLAASSPPSRGGVFGDAALAVDLVELHRDSLAHALLLHRHAVQHVGDLHRALAVRDHDELALLEELLDDQV